MRENIYNKVVELIAKNTNLKIEDINVYSTFEDLGMDSLDQMTVISELEKEYKIILPNEEVPKIKTVGQAVESLQKFLTQ